MPGLVARLPDLQQQRILFGAQLGRIGRMIEDQAFHHVLQRPVDQLGTDVAVPDAAGELGISIGRPIHQPLPVMALSERWP